VLLYVLSFGVHDAELGLRGSVASVGRKTIPFQSLIVILRDTLAVGIDVAEIALREWIALVSCQA
jgi:hypothetical protein